MDLDKLKKLTIPATPGSYQFFDNAGKIIYVGKATNLRSRVSSYWRESTAHTPAKQQLIEKTKKIEWIETGTEIEALLLEANLVKKYQPKYNILLRDDKRFAYIKISTEETWPRIFFTRQIDKSGRYFGPFTSSEAVREVLKVIRKIWPFRSCATLPKKVCLYYRIGKCPGMCQYPVDHAKYLKTISEITKFLEGKRKEVEKNLHASIVDLQAKLEKIKPGSEKYQATEREINFEKYRLLNIKKVLEFSNLLSIGEKYAADVIELAKILNLKNIPERIEGYDISNTFGKEAVGSMVVFANGEPNKNEYRKFKIRGHCKPSEACLPAGRQSPSTKEKLDCHVVPLSGTPRNDKRVDDTAMLKEILERRLNNNWPLPDLIIVDGGKGQLNAILSILKKHKKDIPVIGISKGEGLRSAQAPDKIFFPGVKTPLQLPLASPALHIIKRVRDEAHRFAITFHRQRRSQALFKK